MKIQDILFLIIFAVVVLKRNSTVSTIIGLACIGLSIPLFGLWVFFTAQHLLYYAAAFFLLSIFLLYRQK